MGAAKGRDNLKPIPGLPPIFPMWERRVASGWKTLHVFNDKVEI